MLSTIIWLGCLGQLQLPLPRPPADGQQVKNILQSAREQAEHLRTLTEKIMACENEKEQALRVPHLSSSEKLMILDRYRVKMQALQFELKRK